MTDRPFVAVWATAHRRRGARFAYVVDGIPGERQYMSPFMFATEDEARAAGERDLANALARRDADGGEP